MNIFKLVVKIIIFEKKCDFLRYIKNKYIK